MIILEYINLVLSFAMMWHLPLHGLITNEVCCDACQRRQNNANNKGEYFIYIGMALPIKSFKTGLGIVSKYCIYFQSRHFVNP